MRYTRIQRDEYEPIITIGEYIQATAPGVYAQLLAFIMKAMAINGIIFAANRLKGIKENIAHIMTERPKPGRGGLLPGEGEEVLHD